jgi:hypothetical protein
MLFSLFSAFFCLLLEGLRFFFCASNENETKLFRPLIGGRYPAPALRYG